MLNLDALRRFFIRDTTTLADVWSWWAQTYLQQLANAPTIAARMRTHVLPALGQLGPEQLTPAVVEQRLNALGSRLAPATLNGIASHLRRIIHDAQGEGLWPAANPLERVRARRVPQRIWPTLTRLEALALLTSAEGWRNAWALMLYVGLRKGEVLGLQVGDVDRARRLLHVQRTARGNGTKNTRARILPISDELWPYVVDQLERANGGLLFAGSTGQLRRADEKLARRLRTDLKRAEVVDGYWSICRWCSTRERTVNNSPARCPGCSRKLWLEPVPKHLRAHDLRHTFTTLAAEAGVDREVLRHVLGHAGDVTSLYLHLGPERVRGELSKLTLHERKHE